MKKAIALILVLALVYGIAMPAFASNFYIIPDSDTRRLTEEELWEWQYDALGYIFNEIFARHGYHFKPGGKYDNYFRAQSWYVENTKYDTNQEIYHHLVTSVEWANESLAKKVRADMRALGTTNPDGKPLPKVKYEAPIENAFSSFFKYPFKGNQKLLVYSGPGTNYLRSNNNKAMVSTNGDVYIGGFENGWLMVMYWTNGGNIRVGYVKSSAYKDKVQAPMLVFDYVEAETNRHCVITDDPVATYDTMKNLPKGTRVTYLSEYINSNTWAYVEVTVDGVPMRGFILADYVDVLGKEADEPSQADLYLYK